MIRKNSFESLCLSVAFENIKMCSNYGLQMLHRTVWDAPSASSKKKLVLD